VKLAGAAYLVWLGIKALRNKRAPLPQARHADVRPMQLFRDGVVVAFLNPKTALFFAALLPQFVDPSSSTPLAQNLIFGSVFVGVALCTDTLYVVTASGLRTAVVGRSEWARLGRYLSAATFFALGIYAAVASPRSAR
jgi:threonine/homoserine/homoserine lactone efflux protein